VKPALVILEEYKAVGGPVRGYWETLAEAISPIEFVAMIIKSIESPGGNPVKVTVLDVSALSMEGMALRPFNV
jgi:hypothetical protein